jgi:hypothetical protein
VISGSLSRSISPLMELGIMFISVIAMVSFQTYLDRLIRVLIRLN